MLSFEGTKFNLSHLAIRNMADAGLDDKRIMEFSGHRTRATLDRYNIGLKGDLENAREAIERFHPKQA
jgi:hypothetical protein